MDFKQIMESFGHQTSFTDGQQKGEFGFVYMFYGQDKYPVYIGSTKNPEARLRSHFPVKPRNDTWRSGCLTKDAYDSVQRIMVAYAGNAYDCRAIESWLIRKYNPSYNTIIPFEHEEKKPSNLVFVSFTKQQFMDDPSIVWRCFTEIIKRYKNKCYELEQNLSIYKLYDWRNT